MTSDMLRLSSSQRRSRLLLFIGLLTRVIMQVALLEQELAYLSGIHEFTWFLWGFVLFKL